MPSELTCEERAAIEAVVRASSLPFSEFEWIKRQDILLHQESPSLLSIIRRRSTGYSVCYRPGPLPRYHAVEVVRKWEDVLRLTGQWLRYIERDVYV